MQKKGGFRPIVLRVLLTLLLMAAAAGVTYLSFGTSRTIRRLRRENTALLTQYNILSHRLDDALDVMSDIQQRDDNLYRVLLMADPVSEHVRSASYASTNRYEALESLDDAALVVNVTQKMDLLTRQLYIQSESFNQVVGFFKNHEDMLAHLPAIQPISNNDLKHTASGYGSRIDPVYGTVRFHYGMDFTCDIGTPVFATADGRIASTGWEQGYGGVMYTPELPQYLADRFAEFMPLYRYLQEATPAATASRLRRREAKSNRSSLVYPSTYISILQDGSVVWATTVPMRKPLKCSPVSRISAISRLSSSKARSQYPISLQMKQTLNIKL